MNKDNFYMLYSTFFIWFLSWTLIESVMNYYKLKPLSKIKIVFILLVIAIINYTYISGTYISDTKDSSE